MFDRGIIVSIQGYSSYTTQELAENAQNAGAVAIRTDKKINVKIPVIGLIKIKVTDMLKEPYITVTTEDIKKVSEWAQFVAIDYRKINKHIKVLSDYCKQNKIKVIADIGSKEDYDNIKNNDYYYEYIATTMSVLRKHGYPDKYLVRALFFMGCKKVKIIAEGNYRSNSDVVFVMKNGAYAVCMGGAISNVYKLTRRYTTLDFYN